jgi:hypothetical protein
MGFGLNLNITGDFLPIVKIDARTGRIVRVDRDEGGEQRLVDMTDVFEGVFDLAHAEAGWAYFEDGQAPDFLMEPIGKPLPQRPSKDHRQGVRLRLILSTKAAGGTERVREVTTTAKCVMRGLEALYNVWLAGRERNTGMTVLVRLAGVKPVFLKSRGQKSTIYEPTFEVVRWVKIPAEFEMPPERPASPPNGIGAAAAHPGREKPVPTSPKTTPLGPTAEADDWS